MQAVIGKNLQTIWAWTYGQLPGWLVLPGFAKEWSKPLRINTVPVIVEGITPGERLDLELSSDLMLRKQLTVPLAARSSLSKAVDLNMRQSLPSGGSKLVWRYVIEKRNRSELQVGIYLIKRKTLEQIEAAIVQKKGQVRTIRAAVSGDLPPLIDYRRSADRNRRFWDICAGALVTASVCLVFAKGFRTNLELNSQVAVLEQEKADLNTAAISLKEQLDEENSSQTELVRDIDLFLSEQQRLPKILDLTEALDEETWVSELVFSGTKIRLAGFSGHDVTEVMDKIRSLTWVEQVNLDGPVTFDTYSRKNRFDLSIVIVSAGELRN